MREPVSAWTHFCWLLFALPATALLVRKSYGEPIKRIGMLVFGCCLTYCAAASTVYHGVPAEWSGFFALFDYIGIYLLIAGTCTPIVLTLLSGVWRWCSLVLAWGLASIGIVLVLSYGELPRFLYTSLYLSMGWGVAFSYFELARVLSHRTLRPIVLGGLCYTTGAVCNLIGFPVLWTGVVGAHEVLHIFVMLGSWIHYRFLLQVVIPYQAPD